MASIVSLVFVSAYIYLQHPKFGSTPSGVRLERIRQSRNYYVDKFRNQTETPTFAEGHTFWSELGKSLFKKYAHRVPGHPIPSVKRDLKNLPIDSTVVVWFGHSSCFIQINRKKILIDPIFGENASPIPGSVKAFEGTTSYSTGDMPDIDYLLISHDHYHHLDYETVVTLKDKVKHVICGLGVGAHLERWGYVENRIVEMDWYDIMTRDSAFTIHALPARHKSGRGLKQNDTLWLSFLIRSPQTSIYISGDGGYDKHFAEIGEKFGPIELAIMENGQYDSAWHYVHLLPEETLLASRDLGAKQVLPVHHSKFVLARHPWYEPLDRLSKTDKSIKIVTPVIGEIVYLNAPNQVFERWWDVNQ